MSNEIFWISGDGVITTAKESKGSTLLELTIASNSIGRIDAGIFSLHSRF